MRVMEEKKNVGAGLLMSSVSGILPGIVVTLLLLLISAMLVSADKLPTSLCDELVIVSAFVGACAAGSYASKRRGRGVLTTGLCAGLCFLLLIKLISACVPSGSILGGLSLKTAISAISGGAFGGALRSGKKRSKNRRK